MKRSWWLSHGCIVTVYCSYHIVVSPMKFSSAITPIKVFLVIYRRYNIVFVDSRTLCWQIFCFFFLFLVHRWTPSIRWFLLFLIVSLSSPSQPICLRVISKRDQKQLESIEQIVEATIVCFTFKLWFIWSFRNYYGRSFCKTYWAWNFIVLLLRIPQGQMDIIIFICLAYCICIIWINRYLMVLVNSLSSETSVYILRRQ